MSSETAELNQIGANSNDKATAASPPPYVPASNPVVQFGLDAPPPVDSSMPMPSSSQAPYNLPKYTDHSQPLPSGTGYPPNIYPSQPAQQPGYYTKNIAGANTSAAFHQQYAAQPLHVATTFGTHPGAVVRQPVGVFVGQPVQMENVPNKMVCSIVSTFCCCFFLGIPAIILSSQANSLRTVDPPRAISKARTARTLNIISFILGTIFIVGIVVLRYSVGFSTSSSSTYYY